jgi:Snf7
VNISGVCQRLQEAISHRKRTPDVMAGSEWSLKQLPGYASRSPEELRVLWSADLPESRDMNPALWDTLLGFFEDAAVASCSRRGALVVTPRQLLRQLKHEGREPSAGRAVIEELFRRGDIVRASPLPVPTSAPATTSPLSLSGVKSVLSSYIWGTSAPAVPSLDDPIVPTAALAAVAARAKDRLGGPVTSDDIHTVQSFADELTAGSTRDAEAVIAALVAKKSAAVIYTDATPDQPEPLVGFKFGGNAPTAADKGILQTKAALHRMEQLAIHLDKGVLQETAAATLAARAGNKAEALARLRKKKLLDNKLAGARASVHKLTDVLMAVDEAASNKEAVQALEIGMDSLRVANENGVSAERVDAIAADYADAVADQDDVRTALQQLNISPDGENDLAAEEAELDAMLAAETASKVGSAGGLGVAELAAEDAEMERIMAELGIEKHDIANLPVPPSPEEAPQADQDVAKWKNAGRVAAPEL